MSESIPIAQLRAAVARGILTQAQLDAILADPAPLEGAPPREEAPHALNAVSVAYYLGAAAVVFALGWFLAEQWNRVGAAGVLAIALLYALLFGTVARWLSHRGFHTAAAMATLLTVCTAPLAAWAILELVHWWPIASGRSPIDELRWIPVELTLAAAALFALRRVRFALLALPVTAGIWLALMSARVLLREPTAAWLLDPYLALVVGTLFIAAGYRIDRAQIERARSAERRGEPVADHAVWPYLFGGATLVFALAALWDDARALPHLTVALSLLSIAIAVRIGRRSFLAFGAIGVFAYLGHLAHAFRDTSLFPLVLALLGGAVIVGTVWLQRRYPGLVRGRSSGEPRPLPGGMWGPLAALAFSLALTVWASGRVDAWEAKAAAERREALRRVPPAGRKAPPQAPH